MMSRGRASSRPPGGCAREDRERVPAGVGPDGDIVAYSSLRTHMGCPVVYDGGSTCAASGAWTITSAR